jgi:ubiquinone/menaquinone biosynthesis C-methylase UbiE
MKQSKLEIDMDNQRPTLARFLGKTMHKAEKARRETAIRLLDSLVSVWPSPMKKFTRELGAEPGTLEYEIAYGQDQFVKRMTRGLGRGLPLKDLWGKRALEIGCGHGGISCFLACMGAETTGIDLNTDNLQLGRQLSKSLATKMNRDPLPVDFQEMDAVDLNFPDNTFDFVLADNLMEHVVDPEAVLNEAKRVLAPNGLVVLPGFSSLYSKYGIHLKNGLKLPWANLVFSDKTIIGVLQRQSKKRPELLKIYPGLAEQPESVREVRKYQDLNDITYAAFREMAERAGFEITYFRVEPTISGIVIRKIAPFLEKTFLFDVLSTGAAAVLRAR